MIGSKFKVGETVGMTEHRGHYRSIIGDTVVIASVERNGGGFAYECKVESSDPIIDELFFFECELTKI